MYNNVRVFNAGLDLYGTIKELINWLYRYSDNYSAEALDEIAKQAESLEMPMGKCLILTLVKLKRSVRQRKMERPTMSN